KKTIVADTSQIGQGKLPQTGSSNTSSLIILGYALIVFSILLLLSKSRHIYGTTDYYN
ncbi:LPXTG cell wall anchor domain-containing protein, partial [Enterococcus casseliflavus]|nr:LPXTG cell wall anchor domain-containing protein [Enterococcus casseliflavus]